MGCAAPRPQEIPSPLPHGVWTHCDYLMWGILDGIGPLPAWAQAWGQLLQYPKLGPKIVAEAVNSPDLLVAASQGPPKHV
jgi:hypothetical protein